MLPSHRTSFLPWPETSSCGAPGLYPLTFFIGRTRHLSSGLVFPWGGSRLVWGLAMPLDRFLFFPYFVCP